MNIYFAWVSAQDDYNESIHSREDEKIFTLGVTQKEGGFARARLQIQNPGYGLLWPKDKQHCMISTPGHPLFKGRLIAMPTQIAGELITIEFIGIVEDCEAKKKALCQDIMNNGVYDRLFFHESEPPLRDLLQAYTALPYWHRITGELSLSNIFRGKKSIDLGGDFLRDSLKVSVSHEPLKEINVSLDAQWLQQAGGIVEIGQHIKKACPKGYLSSLTGSSLEQAWWKPKSAFKQNGYKIQHSELNKISPFHQDFFPTASKPFWHKDEHLRQVQFPRTWYDLQLRLGWSYKQKRREVAQFCLKQAVQDICMGGVKSKALHFSLASIIGKNSLWQPQHVYTKGFQVLHDDVVYRCLRRHQSGDGFDSKKWERQDNLAHVDGQAARSQFFITERGQQAVSYAMEVAKAHLAASARCISISVVAPLHKLKDVTLDHEIIIRDPRLPGGEVSGKAVGYALSMDGHTGQQLAEVKLGVSIGLGISWTKPFPQEEFYADYGVPEINPSTLEEVHGRTKSSICYRMNPGQAPNMGIQRPTLMSEYDLIQNIEIIDDADLQEKKLSKRQFPHSNNIKQALQQMPTNLRIKLKDLKTYGRLERHVHIDVLTTWSAPKHIDLSAPANKKE